MANKPLPTLERVRQLLSYDPLTGEFRWKERPCLGWKKTPELIAGTKLANGYIRIRIDRQNYMAHRLAWLMETGREPKEQIDHINGDRSFNAFANLREATGSENQQNRPVGENNRSGKPGVSFNQRQRKWRAQIKVRGAIKHLGWHDSIDAAARAYEAAKAELHPFSPTVRAS